MNTYTGTGGTTVQGQQVTSTQKALDGLNKVSSNVQTMTQNRPQEVEALRTKLTSDYQVPQATAQQGNLMEMLKQMHSEDQKIAGEQTIDTSSADRAPGGYPVNPYLSPGLTTGRMQGDTDATLKLLDSLSGYISKGHEQVKSGVASNEATFRDSLNSMMGLAQNYVDVYKQLKTVGLSQKDIAELQLKGMEIGAVYDPNTNSYTYNSGKDPVAEVIKQGGSSILMKAKNKEERISLARDIIESGGVSAYRSQLPLADLVDSTEEKELGKQTDLLALLDSAVPLFEKDVLGGTGPLAQFVPGLLAGSFTREKRRIAEQLGSMYQQMISGKTISDKEAKRLAKFLPNSAKTETQNYEDLQHLREGIMNAQTLFEQAKREGLTIDEAYRKYGNASQTTGGTGSSDWE